MCVSVTCSTKLERTHLCSQNIMLTQSFSNTRCKTDESLVRPVSRGALQFCGVHISPAGSA